MNEIELKLANDKSYKISDKLYGIFLEDINFAVDGGLNANQIANYSFDGVYQNNKPVKFVYDPLRYWIYEGKDFLSCDENQIHQNSKFARCVIDKEAYLYNLGYNGFTKYINKPSISILKDHSYEFSMYVKGSFKGKIIVSLLDKDNKATTEELSFTIKENWEKVSGNLTGISDSYSKLCLKFVGDGIVDLDLVNLNDMDYWNKESNKYKYGKFRKDLVLRLKELNPKFMRFPGGCIVEGNKMKNNYNWKDTVGELYARKQNYNLWSEKMRNGGYSQSYQIGFYEYFCICEDLNIKPMPILNAGLICQARSKEKYVLNNDEYNNEIVNNYLDLIDFCKGKKGTSKWADLRCEMGHEEPFKLEMIGVGNENFGNYYHESFKIIQKAIKEKDPSIELIFCAGLLPFSITLAKPWKFAREYNKDGYLDEHSYNSDAWFLKAYNRFDKYPRNTTRVYFGEYSANGLMSGKFPNATNSCQLHSAIAESVFLEGCEKNGDVVAMTSFAPLFEQVECQHWFYNLIIFNPKESAKTVNYLVQELFANNVGDTYIPTETIFPKNVYSSVTKDNNHTYIKVSNYKAAPFDLVINSSKATIHQISGEFSSKNILPFEGDPINNVVINTNEVIGDDKIKVNIKENSVTVIVI